MIYDGAPSRMLPALAATVRQRLEANTRCMYFNSPAMVAGFRAQLHAAGTDVDQEIARGALLLVGDNAYFVNGRFDADRMIQALDESVQVALDDGFAGLFATGDMSWELGATHELAKLLDYEWKLEHLFHKHAALSGICQYHCDLLPPEAVREGLVSHASLFISDTIARLNPHYVVARSPAERRSAAVPGLDAAISVLLAVHA
jgi:hypothetical protein